MDQCDEGVWSGTPVFAAVLGLGKRADFNRDLGVAAQGSGEGRDSGLDVAHVGDDHGIACEPHRVLRGVIVERTAEFLLAFEDDLEVDRRLAVEIAQGSDMRHQVGLVVGHTPSVDDAVLFNRLKRLMSPQGLVARRLNVVVRVEKDGRRTGWTLNLGEDYR